VTAKGDLMKSPSLFTIIFIATVPIKFGMFYRKYPKICKLIKVIVSKLKPTSMQRAKDDEKGIEKVVKAVGIFIGISILPYIYHQIQTTPRNWIDIAIQITYFPSGLTLDFINLMLQFSYFNFCIQICSLLKQIEDDLKEISLIRDKKRLTEMLGDIVEFHQEIHEIIAELLDCFKYILSLNFVLNIWQMGQSLIFSVDSNWMMFIITSPFFLYEAWIFCYASQTVITRVINSI
jgi:7tm Odorant receptor